MALDPLLAWSRAVWDAFVPTQQLHLAWRYAEDTVALQPSLSPRSHDLLAPLSPLLNDLVGNLSNTTLEVLS